MRYLGRLFIKRTVSLIFAYSSGAKRSYFYRSQNALASVPQIISYQGRLTNSSGTPSGATVAQPIFFKFSIWDNQVVGSGSKLAWVRRLETTSTVTSGVFNVNIGDTAAGYRTLSIMILIRIRMFFAARSFCNYWWYV